MLISSIHDILSTGKLTVLQMHMFRNTSDLSAQAGRNFLNIEMALENPFTSYLDLGQEPLESQRSQ